MMRVLNGCGHERCNTALLLGVRQLFASRFIKQPRLGCHTRFVFWQRHRVKPKFAAARDTLGSAFAAAKHVCQEQKRTGTNMELSRPAALARLGLAAATRPELAVAQSSCALRLNT